MRKVEAVREGCRWAIRHGAGYLGHVDTEAEALALVRALQDAQASALSPDAARSSSAASLATHSPGRLAA